MEAIAGSERVRLVRRLVAELPEKLRIPVYLYYSRELSVEGIASALHIPAGTVKSRLHRAREVLKDRLEWDENLKIKEVNEYAKRRKRA